MTDFLLLAFIFLCAGVVAVPIATRFGLGSVLGFLIAGMAISPILSLLNVDVVAIQHFAEFGVVIMMFLIGMELEPRRLWKMRTRILGLGGAQVVGTALIVGVVAHYLGMRLSFAVTIGLIVALSSTAIVLQTLGEKGLIQSDGGQASFSVLLFQDIAVIPILALLPLIASPDLAEIVAEVVSGDAVSATVEHDSSFSLIDDLPAWQAGMVSVAATVSVLLAGIYLTRPVFRYIAMANLPELFTAFALFLVIGTSLLMILVGLSPALGAFLAGVVLANNEYRHQLEADIKPFRGLLLGLFFITVGAGVDFGLLIDRPGLILGLTFGLMALKAFVLFGLSFGFRVRGTHRWLFALGLCQMGEFGFVLLSFATNHAILPDRIADPMLLMITLSMAVTPLLFLFREKVITRFFDRPKPDAPADTIDEQSDIIIAGRGRVGGIIHRILRAAGFAATVIDFNSHHLELIRKFGYKIYFGDATRQDLLESAGIATAKVLIIAIDDVVQISELVRLVSSRYPHVHIVCRAIDRQHVYELWSLGCRDIIRETYDSSLRMGRSALEAMGLERPVAQDMIDAFDRHDRTQMVEAAETYDVTLPVYENKAFIERIRDSLEQWEYDLSREMDSIRYMHGKPPTSGE